MSIHSRKKKNKLIYVVVLFLLLVLIVLLAGVYKNMDYFFQNVLENQIQKGKIINDGVHEPLAVDLSSGPLYSPHAILIRLKDHKVIYEKNSNQQIFPASMTKIMTGVLAVERITNLHEKMIVPKSIFSELRAENASVAGFLPGEKVPAIDLIYGTMLPSGGDASKALAINIAGSESAFVKLMNKKAEELGMNHTHFTNVSGLHDDNHYSTVKDIATLLEYALKNKEFRQAFTTFRHSTKPSNAHPNGFTFYSTLTSTKKTLEFDGGEILGGKTGYTDEAGLCLASLAEKNDEKFILVTAGADGSNKTEQFQVTDALKVYGQYLKP